MLGRIDDNEIMNAYEKYKESIWKYIKRISKKSKKADNFSENLWNSITGKKNSQALDIELAEEERIALKLFNYYTEIEQSFNKLLDTEVYIRRFPFRNTRINKVNYLEHQIAIYLNEVYIFRERLKLNLKIIEKFYKKSRDILEVKNNVKKVNKYIIESFRDIIKTRGLHIHEQSFYDDDLNQLMLMEKFLTDIPPLKHIYRFNYSKVRKKWKGIIEKNNKDTEKVLIQYYQGIYSLVFDSKGKIIIPY